ncbi:MAG: NAD(P)H-hydrate dehydratase [Candidatus Woesebacteria bacterium]|jgi:NAD(P)H-hydrate epimerase
MAKTKKQKMNKQSSNSDETIKNYLKKIKLAHPNSHKGQNGKLMIIGGSKLFHAASKWSLDIASKFVDMVFYSSIPSNNQLIQEAKKNFWNGIVVARQDIENYIQEADCVLIGPGMERADESKSNKKILEKVNLQSETQRLQIQKNNQHTSQERLSQEEWQNDTQKIVNYLLNKYPQKKWVLDAGALQMMNPNLLNKNCIITPHKKELELILGKIKIDKNGSSSFGQNKNYSSQQISTQEFQQVSELLNKSTILLKGPVDYVISPQGQKKTILGKLKTDIKQPDSQTKIIPIKGGNAGMTKGGTGDVLAGLLAALYCQHDAITSAVVASYINKKAGDKLYEKVGPYFNASDLVEVIPEVIWEEIRSCVL